MKTPLLTVLACILFLTASIFGDFTIGTLPDTQNISENDAGKEKMKNMIRFYIDRRDALNLQFVASLGDMTQNGAVSQWNNVREAYNLLVDAGIPYAPCHGNHDNLSGLASYFPVSDLTGTPTFGGYFNDMNNAYYYLTVDNMEFIIVVIQSHDQFVPYDQPSIDWANGILADNADKRALFVTHDFYERNWLVNDVLSKHDNLFLAVCGHSCSRENYSTVLSPSGNTVHLIMSDYQCDGDGGATNRYYTFKPHTNEICAFTYRTSDQAYETDGNSQFCFEYQMVVPATPQIGSIQRVPVSPGPDEDVIVSVKLTDDKGISSAILKWGIESGNLTHETALSADGEIYSGLIPGQSLGTTIFYAVEASDEDGNIELSQEYSFSIELLEASWNSWDIVLGSAGQQATVTDGDKTAELEFYESSADNSVAGTGLFTSVQSNHPDAFNDLEVYCSGSADYPYAGKNATPRSSEVTEGQWAGPSGVKDFQMHPPDNSHLMVCAFVAPLDGNYKVSNLGVRRVYNGGTQSSVTLADNNHTFITKLATSSQKWSLDNQLYDIGPLSAGERIYFGAGNDDGYTFDAMEVSWTISLFSSTVPVSRTPTAEPAHSSLDYTYSNGLIRFQYPERISSIRVTDPAGKTVFGLKELADRTQDLRSVRKGLYYIQIRDAGGLELVRKLVHM